MRLYILILLAISVSIVKADNIKTIKTKPSKATVFLTGVEITHSDFITLLKGPNEIVLEGTSPGADEYSITAYFKGALVIDTRKVQKYPETPKTFELDLKYNNMIYKIKDSLEDIGFEIKNCTNRFNALDKEKYLLLNNRIMRGDFQKDSVLLLKASLDLLNVRLRAIDDEHLAEERKYSKWMKMKAALDERINYYNLLIEQNSFGQSVGFKVINQIIVTIEAESDVSGSLVVKYYDAAAGWMPKYDISAGSNTEKLELLYRAQVYQNTGLDWNNIALTLSTSNPAQGNTKPILSVWNLYYGYPNTYTGNAYKKKVPQVQNYNSVAPSITEERLNFDQSGSTDDAKENLEPVFTMSENMMRIEYAIKTKYNIASDNRAHNVIINKEEIPVTYTYMAVPKLDNDAFLMGKVSNWEDLNLMPAMARIYFDDSYIGNTVVNPNTVKDTLYLDLGRDKSITVKRQNLKDKCKEQIVGEDKIVTKTVEITIRNTKPMSLYFELEDQIPIAGDATIKVELLKSDGAIFNDLTGKLTWKMNIKSKDTKKVVFSYQVKYPKNKVIGTL
ncbi:MAG: DUF4139 domain-containing protein [Bacteroidia bacterium]|nr:DUF4139 domain-containing protein [Bacteroidia bacterium]